MKSSEMTNLEKLDYAIIETLMERPNTNAEKLLLSLISNDGSGLYIIPQGRAREAIFSLSTNDIIREIAKQALKVGVSDNRFGYLPGKPECIKFLDYVKSKKIKGEDIVTLLQNYPGELDKIARSFAKIRYRVREDLDIEDFDKYSPLQIKSYLNSLDDTKKPTNSFSIRNLRLQNDSINKCRNDIITGMQLKRESSNYSLGSSLFAASSIGKMKSTQEDSVLLTNHPQNKKFKMLMVADGVGGHLNGGKASQNAATDILEWFESLDERYFDKPEELTRLLVAELDKINKKLYKEGDGRATTFLCGIVGKSKTLVASVGDSRAYITKDNMLKQVTRDDSIVQSYYENGHIRSKADMRFHKKSNYITKSLGLRNDISPNIYYLDNDSYDSLILLSDGVSDCLSDSQIIAISKKTSRQEIAKALVNAANTTVSYRRRQDMSSNYYDKIPAGKDNATAAVYSRKK